LDEYLAHSRGGCGRDPRDLRAAVQPEGRGAASRSCGDGRLSTILLEAAIDSIAAADRAVAEGADRLEVCGDLTIGGVTPSMELLRDCLTLGVPCMAMARPSGGPFVLSDTERAGTVLDAARMIDLGAHGVVFGGITPTGVLDGALIDAVVRVVDGAETVFHRAFDHAIDARAALDAVINAGVSRVLTGGHRGGAWDGRAALADLVTSSAGRIAILPGGGVRAPHARDLLNATGASQLHARATDPGVIAALRAAVI
jgi:copper homeostasis protein